MRREDVVNDLLSTAIDDIVDGVIAEDVRPAVDSFNASSEPVSLRFVVSDMDVYQAAKTGAKPRKASIEISLPRRMVVMSVDEKYGSTRSKNSFEDSSSIEVTTDAAASTFAIMRLQRTGAASLAKKSLLDVLASLEPDELASVETAAKKAFAEAGMSVGDRSIIDIVKAAPEGTVYVDPDGTSLGELEIL